MTSKQVMVVSRGYRFRHMKRVLMIRPQSSGLELKVNEVWPALLRSYLWNFSCQKKRRNCWTIIKFFKSQWYKIEFILYRLFCIVKIDSIDYASSMAEYLGEVQIIMILTFDKTSQFWLFFRFFLEINYRYQIVPI